MPMRIVVNNTRKKKQDYEVMADYLQKKWIWRLSVQDKIDHEIFLAGFFEKLKKKRIAKEKGESQ